LKQHFTLKSAIISTLVGAALLYPLYQFTQQTGLKASVYTAYFTWAYLEVAVAVSLYLATFFSLGACFETRFRRRKYVLIFLGLIIFDIMLVVLIW
jgi:hypothetical protein